MCLAHHRVGSLFFQFSCVYMVLVYVCAGTGAHACEDLRLVKEIILDCSSISFTVTGSLNQTQSFPGGFRAPSLSELELRADGHHLVTLVLGIGTLFLTIALYPWAITPANQRDFLLYHLLWVIRWPRVNVICIFFHARHRVPSFPVCSGLGLLSSDCWLGGFLWFPGFCLTASGSRSPKHPFIGYVQRGFLSFWVFSPSFLPPVPLSLLIQCLAFYVSPGIWTQVLLLVQQALYQLSCLPGLTSSFEARL